jgi:hypothetical protein
LICAYSILVLRSALFARVSKDGHKFLFILRDAASRLLRMRTAFVARPHVSRNPPSVM